MASKQKTKKPLPLHNTERRAPTIKKRYKELPVQLIKLYNEHLEAFKGYDELEIAPGEVEKHE